MNTQTKWPGFGYVQVPGLANRHIARWLRTQRKNMRAFFASRGLYELALRMDQIRKSRQGMMAKNRMFQEVLDTYAKLSNPGAAPVASSEAGHQENAAGAILDVPAAGEPDPQVRGEGPDAGGGVSGLASPDQRPVVIEE